MSTFTMQPETLTSTSRSLLALAAKTPGVTTQRIQAELLVGNVADETLRHHLARLRQAGLLYSSRPCWVLLRADYLDFLRKPELVAHKHQAGVSLVVKQCLRRGPMLQQFFVADLAKKLTATRCHNLLTLLRDEGVLHPWHGLVLSPAGEQAARKLHMEVVPQCLGHDEPPSSWRP